MKCPFCKRGSSEVLESRIVDDGTAVRRRRLCAKCGKRFTTFERVQAALLLITKKDGSREAFDPEKLKRGIVRAVGKRPIAATLIDDIVGSVHRELLNKKTQEISSRTIGRAVLTRLKKIDKVAWLRFASVYLEFDDIADFEALIEKTNI